MADTLPQSRNERMTPMSVLIEMIEGHGLCAAFGMLDWNDERAIQPFVLKALRASLLSERQAKPAFYCQAGGCESQCTNCAEESPAEHGQLPDAPRSAVAPVDQESEAANPVWDLVVATCRKAWPERERVDWNQSPTELIIDIINERDEALREAEQQRNFKHLANQRLEDAARLCESAGGDAGRVVGPKLAAKIRALNGSARSHELPRERIRYIAGSYFGEMPDIEKCMTAISEALRDAAQSARGDSPTYQQGILDCIEYLGGCTFALRDAPIVENILALLRAFDQQGGYVKWRGSSDSTAKP